MITRISWIFFYSLGVVFLKFARSSVYYIAFIRYSFSFILYFLHRRKVIVSPKLLLRSLLQFTATLLTYIGYRELSLVSSTIIGQTSPAVTTIFACIAGESHFSFKIFTKLILGYTAILISNGGFGNIQSYGTMYLIFANILNAIVVIMSKQILKEYRVIELEVLGSLFNSIMFGIISLVLFDSTSIYIADLYIIPLLAISFIISRLTQLYAIRDNNISAVALFEYLRIAIAIAFEYVLFGQSPSYYNIIGAAVILLAVIW